MTTISSVNNSFVRLMGIALRNYWLIVVEQGTDRQQYQVHQQATAALLMDLWMRRLLDPGPAPASAHLYWVNDDGEAKLRVEMRFPARTLQNSENGDPETTVAPI